MILVIKVLWLAHDIMATIAAEGAEPPPDEPDHPHAGGDMWDADTTSASSWEASTTDSESSGCFLSASSASEGWDSDAAQHAPAASGSGNEYGSDSSSSSDSDSSSDSNDSSDSSSSSSSSSSNGSGSSGGNSGYTTASAGSDRSDDSSLDSANESPRGPVYGGPASGSAAEPRLRGIADLMRPGPIPLGAGCGGRGGRGKAQAWAVVETRGTHLEGRGERNKATLTRGPPLVGGMGGQHSTDGGASSGEGRIVRSLLDLTTW